MFRPRISVSTFEFGQDLRRALQTAMQMQAEGVQFDLRNQLRPADFGETARKQILHYLAERNLAPASGTFSLRRPLCEPEHLDARLQAIREALTFAAQMKLRTLTLRIGKLPADDAAEYQDLWLPILRELATVANHRGVMLGIIPAGDTPEALLNLIVQVKTGPVCVAADLGGWVLSGRKPHEQLRTLHEVVGHVEVRDATRDIDGIGEETPMGRGEVDWDEVAGLLGEMDYHGWLNVRRSTGNDKLGDMTRAIQYLRNLLLMES